MADQGESSRFSTVESIDEFKEGQANSNTRRKTRSDMLEFLKTVKFETRAVENIPATELKAYLNEFVLSVRKKQNKDEYEPCTLKSFISSFERYLKRKYYGWSISLMMLSLSVQESTAVKRTRSQKTKERQ